MPSVPESRFQVVDFNDLPEVPCPCGTARRAFTDLLDYPATIHVTETTEEARLHYHRRITETYYFLECDDDAAMQLDEELVKMRPGLCVRIPPGVRHRAVGRMKVLIVAIPKFDPADEWLV